MSVSATVITIATIIPVMFQIFSCTTNFEEQTAKRQKKMFDLLQANASHDQQGMVSASLFYKLKSLTFSLQLFWFALGQINQPMPFKIFGVVNLNYKVMFNLLATSFSYFVVLLQFEMDG